MNNLSGKRCFLERFRSPHLGVKNAYLLTL